MLKGISPIINPDLLHTIYCMGHGDEIVFSDAHFPAHSVNTHVIRADGVNIADLLEAILPLFELDYYVDNPVVMMAAVPGDKLDPAVEMSYWNKLKKYYPRITQIERLERFAFYDRAKKAYAVVVTSDVANYGNILLKKGVTPT